MNSFARSLIVRTINDLEGEVSDLKGDKGGLTVFGLSSRYHGTFVRRAMRLIASGKRDQAFEEAVGIYYRDYYTRIYGWRELEASAPWLLSLLFVGRVHGIGQRDYVREMQTYLNQVAGTRLVVDGLLGPRTMSVFRSLSSRMQDMLLEHFRSPSVQARLVQSRVKAVGGYENGIRNRVLAELAMADQYRGGGVDKDVMVASRQQMDWTPSSADSSIEVRSYEPETRVTGTRLLSV